MAIFQDSLPDGLCSVLCEMASFCLGAPRGSDQRQMHNDAYPVGEVRVLSTLPVTSGDRALAPVVRLRLRIPYRRGDRRAPPIGGIDRQRVAPVKTLRELGMTWHGITALGKMCPRANLLPKPMPCTLD